jgi:Pyruvate/2-oxoacid:ferredoxin oxidoreductase delta subunit
MKRATAEGYTFQEGQKRLVSQSIRLVNKEWQVKKVILTLAICTKCYYHFSYRLEEFLQEGSGVIESTISNTRCPSCGTSCVIPQDIKKLN